jgi:hypothetical protein
MYTSLQLADTYEARGYVLTPWSHAPNVEFDIRSASVEIACLL